MPTTVTSLALLIVIINRGFGDKLADIFIEKGILFNYLTLGKGTADTSILAYLGLGISEKDVLFSCLPLPLSRVVLEKLDKVLLSSFGGGIAISIPLCAIAGMAHGKCMPEEKGGTAGGEGKAVEQHDQPGSSASGQSCAHNLIVAIMNRGYVDEVMSVAKAAGASGGTVLHARGVGMKYASKVLGITIHPEKDVLLIVTPQEKCRQIMTAITEQKGAQTDANTVAFSLVVDGIAGLSFHY
ncbi:MAG TPA: hypothetical protein GXX29_00605 [Firmicutes bacterium]|nr:hypothetical protein [Bacillota bacterium]